MLNIDKQAVLSFFTGKAYYKAEDALANIEASLAEGSWLKGVSRSVRAALSKSNVAEKRVTYKWNERKGEHTNPDANDRKFDYDDARHNVHWALCHTLHFGLMDQAVALDVSPLDSVAELADLLAFFKRYVDTFKPVAEAMAYLDACRPKPVFTELGASPTITATLTSLGATKVAVCPMHHESYDRVDPKTGKTEHVFITYLDWPKGTVFGAGPYGYGLSKCQCESCGHGIKNPFNWVPLVLTTKPNGTPAALWVGRDCAETLFGVKLTGELEIAPESKAAP